MPWFPVNTRSTDKLICVWNWIWVKIENLFSTILERFFNFIVWILHVIRNCFCPGLQPPMSHPDMLVLSLRVSRTLLLSLQSMSAWPFSGHPGSCWNTTARRLMTLMRNMRIWWKGWRDTKKRMMSRLEKVFELWCTMYPYKNLIFFFSWKLRTDGLKIYQ